MTNPFFSVIIPTYNSASYIEKTLESVFAQDHKNYEIVICDDASTDQTVETLHNIKRQRLEFSITIIRNKTNQGHATARNKAIREAKGEWMAFLDSDDFWFPNKLQCVCEYLEQQPEMDLICHNVVYKNKRKTWFVDHTKLFDSSVHPFFSLFRRNALNPSATVVRKSAIENLGLFDESFKIAPDYDLWLSLAKADRIGFLKDVLGIYWVRENSLSKNPLGLIEEADRICEKHKKDLPAHCSFPALEILKYKSRYQLSAGLLFWRDGSPVRGALYITRGFLMWPFWIKEGIKKVFRGY